MKSAASKRGDSHNFGRRVSLNGKRVKKPRELFWEWLLLSAKSPLRRFLAARAAAEGNPGAFHFLPTLEFARSRTRVGGEVEALTLRPLTRLSTKTRRELSSVVGRSLALWSFLGVSDLHWENLVLGTDARGQIVFGPLDIELILADLSLPTETKLLPDADPEYAEVCRHACGVRRVLPYLGKPIAASDLLEMAAAYRGALAFLERHSAAIASLLSVLPELHAAPIRVLLRGTGDYVHAAEHPPWPPLLDAEVEQLSRGDIPYFFRLYGRRGIHYYGNESLTELRRLPLQGDVPKLDPLLSLSRGLRAPSRKRLREEGLFTLLGAFDHTSLTGTHASPDLKLRLGARSMSVVLPDGERLETRRNVRAFVGSVYLPCKCGEVRSVFVPPVTHCTETAAR